jgi:vitamin K-dependent gamma-carboxylase
MKLTLWMVMFVVYFDASFAKINNDWLRGEPLRHWLPKRKPRLGWFLAQESLAYTVSYAGILYDALAAPLLMIPQTRAFGLIFNCMFHLSNYAIFNIGIFPWLCMSMNIIFIDSETYVRPILDWFSPKEEGQKSESKPSKTNGGMTWKKYLLVTVLILYTLYHVLFPLRFALYPGDVAWTEYGHLFSWRMKLRDKNCGIFGFRVRNVEKNLTGSVPLQK